MTTNYWSVLLIFEQDKSDATLYQNGKMAFRLSLSVDVDIIFLGPKKYTTSMSEEPSQIRLSYLPKHYSKGPNYEVFRKTRLSCCKKAKFHSTLSLFDQKLV